MEEIDVLKINDDDDDSPHLIISGRRRRRRLMMRRILRGLPRVISLPVVYPKRFTQPTAPVGHGQNVVETNPLRTHQR